MNKLVIEVQAGQGLPPLIRVLVDGEPVGCIQSLKLEANMNEVEMEATLPDTDLGRLNGERLNRFSFITVLLSRLVGG